MSPLGLARRRYPGACRITNIADVFYIWTRPARVRKHLRIPLTERLER